MNKKIAEIKAQFVTVKSKFFIRSVEQGRNFYLVKATSPNGWEHKEHIMKPCGMYPLGSSMNTIEGKLMFMGASPE